jgi:hypothetical protein
VTLIFSLQPLARIVYAPYTHSPNSSLGTFDLACPVSALTFAQFILNLSTHSNHVCAFEGATSPIFCTNMDWRGDSLFYESPSASKAGPQWRDRVSKWVDGIHMPDTSRSAHFLS